MAARCGVWSGHVNDALKVLVAAGLVRRTRDARYSLVHPCEELVVAQVLGHWFEIGSPRLSKSCEVSTLMMRLRSQLEGSLNQTGAEGAGLDDHSQVS